MNTLVRTFFVHFQYSRIAQGDTLNVKSMIGDNIESIGDFYDRNINEKTHSFWFEGLRSSLVARERNESVARAFLVGITRAMIEQNESLFYDRAEKAGEDFDAGKCVEEAIAATQALGAVLRESAGRPDLVRPFFA